MPVTFPLWYLFLSSLVFVTQAVLCLVNWVAYGAEDHKISESNGSRTKLLPYTNFYVEVLTQFRIKLLHVEVLTNFRIKLLHVEVLAIFPDKTSTLTKLIKNPPPPGILKSPAIKTGFKIWKTSSVQPVSVHLFEVVIWKTTINLIQGKSHFPFYSNDSNSWNHNNPLISIRGPRISITGWKRESDFCPEWGQL